MDLQVEQASDLLGQLRDLKVTAPAILVSAKVGDCMTTDASDWLDVLCGPVDLRALLGWVECV